MQLSKLNVPSPKRLPPSTQGRSTWPLLLGWVAIAAILRFTNLAAKPPWTDEFATLVFSLGNGYQSVPVDEAISVGTLLQPLQTDLGGGFADVLSHLMREDNHPPLYFFLAHGWMKLWPMGQYVSVWVARALPALLGVLSVPAMYLLAQVAFGSAAIAHTIAALTAVSPYGVYLAQEARHYTLSILFVIASLTCFAGAMRHFWRGTA
ncbi:MAG: glycosyltransferase family 39 protein, partial [Cyanobacteriota bacterium]|nr:glycosyltransferase family 39 protein [Cyanobacteriota bacterium]